MVPPTVEKQVNGETGAAVMWVSPTQSFKELGGVPGQQGVKPPPPAQMANWTRQLTRAKMFDDLIGNTDPNLGNWLVDPAWNLILIDHTRAFTPTKDLYHAAHADRWRAVGADESARRSEAQGRAGQLARRPVDSRHPHETRQDAGCDRQAEEEVAMTDVTAHDARVADILSRFDETSGRFLARLERAGERGEQAASGWTAAQIGAHVAMVNNSLAAVVDGSGPGATPPADGLRRAGVARHRPQRAREDRGAGAVRPTGLDLDRPAR